MKKFYAHFEIALKAVVARLSKSGFSLVAVATLMPLSALAQNQTWGGGSGNWDTAVTPDWNGAAWNSGNDNAVFSTAAGTLTVDDSAGVAPVSFNNMTFSSAGNWVITGDALTKTAITGAYSAANGGITEAAVTLSGNSGNVTFNNEIDFSDLGGNRDMRMLNNTGSTLSFDGSFVMQPTTDGDLTARTIYFDGTNNSVTDVAANFVNANTGMQKLSVTFGGNTTSAQATYNLMTGINFGNDTNNGGLFAIVSGNVDLYASSLGSNGTISFARSSNTAIQTENRSLQLMGAKNLSNPFLLSAKSNVAIASATIEQATADTSTLTGNISLDATGANFLAVSGGRLNINGNLTGATPLPIVVGGNGTVVFAGVNGYAVGLDTNLTTATNHPGTVAADLQSGTTIINNVSTNSAFGNSSMVSYTVAGVTTTNAVTVNVEGGATLGGVGFNSKQVTQAMAHTSVIAPGDSQLGIIGTLHLTAGLTTTSTAGVANGLTMDFQLNGTGANDTLDMGAGALTLNGAIDINFSNIGGALASTPYTFITGTGTWSGTPTFDIAAPTGYVLDTTYGTNGYLLNTTAGADSFSVEFTAAPEPATWVLMGVGMLMLFGAGKFRRQGI